MEDKIVIDPAICNGKPIFKNTRIAVETVLNFLAAGDTAEDILLAYPMLKASDIQAAIAYAAKIMGNSFNIRTVA